MIYKVTGKTKCDVRNCKNDAAYAFDVKGISGKCFLCAGCLAALSADCRALTVPKSPKNAIKKRLDRAEASDVLG